MYTNIGKKIQTLAKVLAWVGIIFFVIVGAFAIYGGVNTANVNMIAEGVLFFAICPFLCWLSSLTMVGFGKLIETNEEMKNKVDEIERKIKE